MKKENYDLSLEQAMNRVFMQLADIHTRLIRIEKGLKKKKKKSFKTLS